MVYRNTARFIYFVTHIYYLYLLFCYDLGIVILFVLQRSTCNIYYNALSRYFFFFVDSTIRVRIFFGFQYFSLDREIARARILRDCVNWIVYYNSYVNVVRTRQRAVTVVPCPQPQVQCVSWSRAISVRFVRSLRNGRPVHIAGHRRVHQQQRGGLAEDQMERQPDDAAGDRGGRVRQAAGVAAGRQAQEQEKIMADVPSGTAGQEAQEERVRAVHHTGRRAARVARVQLLQIQETELVEHFRARTLASVNRLFHYNNIVL